MKLDNDTLIKIANAPIWESKNGEPQTFADAYEYLSANGWFWKDGEPPDSTAGMERRMTEVLQNLINAVMESK